MKKNNNNLFVAGRLIAGVVVIWVIIASTRGFKLGVSVPIQASEQIAFGQQFTAYTSNPPTSGPYYPTPTDCKVYDTELPLPQAVANMHKGHVVLFYKPSIDSTTWGKIRELGTTLAPEGWFLATANNQISSPLALASWGWYQGFPKFDATQIKAFYEAHKGQAPDNAPCTNALQAQ